MSMDELLDMQLHEIKELNRTLTIIRLPGGFMYVYMTTKGPVSEFIPIKKGKI